MKRVILAGVICALAAAPALAVPTVATVNGYGIWQSGQGGEFTFSPGGFNPLPYYAGVAKNQGTVPSWSPGTFQTFCLEHGEFIYANTTFDVVFNDRAINGGVVPPGDPISVGTAYLYHEFQKGTLSGYDYANVVSRKNSADALQKAIWYLEGESGGSITPAYTALLKDEFGLTSTETDWKTDNSGTYAVAVLNLYALGHAGDPLYLRQDMLVCVPAPGAILLGGIGVSLVGWLKKRRSL